MKLYALNNLSSSQPSAAPHSDIRQVPDTQEVFLSQTSDTSVVVEILECVEEGEAKTDLRAAARLGVARAVNSREMG